MIDMNKEYTTRDGREVRIYATDGGRGNIVHGSVLIEGCWYIKNWDSEGCLWSGTEPAPHDLVEKPRKTVRYYNVYNDGTISPAHFTKEDAEKVSRSSNRVLHHVERVEFKY